MSGLGEQKLVAVDIGNSRLKFGCFSTPAVDDCLPTPLSTLALTIDDLSPLVTWCNTHQLHSAPWFISSVNRQSATQLLAWLQTSAGQLPKQCHVLTSGDLPLQVELARPDHVGNDRLAAAVAANRLREAGRPAIVVDLGTAITVNQISAAGVFCGGAILPGLTTSARALHEMTDLLPLIEMHALQVPPAPVGVSTPLAMQAGLFWGAVGAVRELIAQFSAGLSSTPQVYITGGAAELVVAELGATACFVPHLTLAGICLSAQHLLENQR